MFLNQINSTEKPQMKINIFFKENTLIYINLYIFRVSGQNKRWLQCSIKEWYKNSCNLWLVRSFQKYKYECFISPWNIFKFQKWIYKMYVSNKKIDAIFLFTIRNIFKNSDAHIFIPRNLDFSKKILFSSSVLSFLSAPFIKIFRFDKCNKC